MKSFYFLFIVLFALIGCKRQAKTDVQKEIVYENVDLDFKLFLDLFNKDSVFQMSRVDFPIKVNDFYKVEFELNERTINQNEYHLKKFSINRTSEKESFTDYEQTIEIENEKASIEITGIENGIAIMYQFKKINGKWKLITWIDQST